MTNGADQNPDRQGGGPIPDKNTKSHFGSKRAEGERDLCRVRSASPEESDGPEMDAADKDKEEEEEEEEEAKSEMDTTFAASVRSVR